MPQPASLYPPEPEGLGQVRDEHDDDDDNDEEEDDDDDDDQV